jgi:putative methionine-R-sulfoxide reductase with GAF domain
MMLRWIKQFLSISIDNEEVVEVRGISSRTHYLFLGIIFGFLFPVFATIMAILGRGMPFHLSSFVEIQRVEPLLWIIDTAPIFLGLFAALVDFREDQLRSVYASLLRQKKETLQLQELTQQVQQQAAQLKIIIEISRQITTLLRLDEVLTYVVSRIQTEFDFYHVHIYLIEEDSDDLVMAEGSGDVGRQLKEKGHRLPAGRGIVGTVSSTNEHFLSNNVNEVLNFVRNPLLPDTNSELAVPLRKGEQVLGVLDVQSEQINRFTQDDVSLLQSIANQTAVAVSNAWIICSRQQ